MSEKQVCYTVYFIATKNDKEVYNTKKCKHFFNTFKMACEFAKNCRRHFPKNSKLDICAAIEKFDDEGVVFISQINFGMKYTDESDGGEFGFISRDNGRGNWLLGMGRCRCVSIF